MNHSDPFTTVFGIRFFNIGLNSMADDILGGKYNQKMIVTPNVDHVIRYEKDRHFHDIYAKADVYLNDSRVLKLFSQAIGNPINSLVSGSDLTARLFEQLTSHQSISVAIIGASEEVVAKIAEIYPIAKLTHHNPPMGFDSDERQIDKCVAVCQQANADIVFLAVGSPKQEIVADRLRAQGVSGCYLCIGASLLFLAGEEKRAPEFVRRANCEWLFRLAQSPKRLAKRYLVDGWQIVPIVLKERQALKRPSTH
ncbi:WecB/TagA/CpsF family glycosyltransferase [Vibrio olivae]|uniref:WecB/TagA/CpsF family glycosyltransferase n=1 Tax=Vibrio olivae TaxID=1243002 RepID=A0ABV5HT04_9VIBR